MDFLSRGDRTPAPQHGQPAHSAPAAKGKKGLPKWLSRLLVIGLAVIVGLAVLWLVYTKINGSESREVNGDKYQAVFLTNNQVYFGKITDLNNEYIVLTDVFYIETPSQSQASATQSNQNYTLRKLGTSELHSPEDKMVINREQVTFWENLKDSSQVVTKIKEYKKNPDAAEQSGSSNQTNTNTTDSSTQDNQSGTDSNTPTTP
jgi:hypothetical protein